MPEVEVIFYKNTDQRIPIREFLEELSEKDRDKCLARIKWLKDRGHEIGPPVSKPLRDGIHELRVKGENRNYRMLYFFHGRMAVVVSHGIVKKTQKVPPQEIEKAIERKIEFEADPDGRAFKWEH